MALKLLSLLLSFFALSLHCTALLSSSFAALISQQNLFVAVAVAVVAEARWQKRVDWKRIKEAYRARKYYAQCAYTFLAVVHSRYY